MTIASILLQPQRFERPAVDAHTAIAEDAMRVLAILAEDAIAEGPFPGAVERAAGRIGTRMQAQIEPRFAAVRDKLRSRVQGIETYFDVIADQITAIDSPDDGLALVRRLLDDLTTLVESLSLSGIRSGIGLSLIHI